MTTIISKPAASTFIVSSVTVDTPHPVESIFGRSGNVVAQDDDYNITQIDPSGASEDDIIAVEGGRFVIHSLEIGSEPVLTGAIVNGDIIQFNGTTWVNISLPPVLDAKISIHAALKNGVHGLTDSGGGTLFLADDGVYRAITHPPAVVTSVFGRTGGVLAAIGDYAISDITGLTTVGSPTDFLAADGIYKPTPSAPVSSVFGRAGIVVAANNDYTLAQIDGLIDSGGGTDFLANDGTYKTVTHPAAPVTSVFGRTGIVIAVSGDYAIDDITGLTTLGAGTNALFDDGIYKAIVHPPDAVDSVFGRTGTVVAVNNDYALAEIDGLIDSGGGTSFLADDGTYKTIASRQIVSPSVADGTTITNAFQTVFDFSPDADFRNSNCLLTIHYQAMNIGGPATWGVHLRSLIGFTVQQNAYGAGVAQNVNSSERASFTITMEAVVSATGNIQIQSFAAIRDHDLANSAANGKTRLTIELV